LGFWRLGRRGRDRIRRLGSPPSRIGSCRAECHRQRLRGRVRGQGPSRSLTRARWQSGILLPRRRLSPERLPSLRLDRRRGQARQHVHPEPSGRGHHHVRQSRRGGPTRSLDGIKIFWNSVEDVAGHVIGVK